MTIIKVFFACTARIFVLRVHSRHTQAHYTPGFNHSARIVQFIAYSRQSPQSLKRCFDIRLTLIAGNWCQSPQLSRNSEAARCDLAQRSSL